MAEILTAVGTAENDALTYTPTGTSAGTFQDAGLNTVFNFTNQTAGRFRLLPGRRQRHGNRQRHGGR